MRVGLTGGIATGKTTVSNLFHDLGITIIDADEIGRTLLEIEPYKSEIIAHFGERLVKDSTIDRKALQQMIFQDETQKLWLEHCLHPAIIAALDEKAKSASSKYCILSIPLLFEAHCEHLVNRILLVDATPETQLERLLKRQDINEELATSIIASQHGHELRRQNAHDIIDNNSDVMTLKNDVLTLHEKYLFLSRQS